MRILYVTNDFPYPLTSGHLRHFYLLRELSRRHELTLLSIVRPTHSPEHAGALAPFVQHMQTFMSSTQGRTRREKVQNRYRALVQRRPIEQAIPELHRAILDLRGRGDFDAAVVSGRSTVAALPALRGVSVVADVCDAESVRLRSALRYTEPWRVPLLLSSYAQVRRSEQQLLDGAQHVLFASGRDRESLGGGRASSTIVPNGVDLDYWRRRSTVRGYDTIVFTGAMQYHPNADAARWLIEHVLPLVRHARRNVRLLIVGRDPPNTVLRAARRHGADVTGAVPDVRPFLEHATVFVAPLRFASGIQNKVLEALAMELPVIASPVAAEGFRTENGDAAPIVVARDEREFATRIVEHLVAADADVAPNPAGRRFVEQHHDWAQCGALLEHVLLDVSSRAAK